MEKTIIFFAPGIPQIYYVGMLAGENDLELMERTKNGRDINRHYYSLEEIEVEQERPVVRKLKELMELRNNHPAFNLDGDIKIQCEGSKMRITRSYNADKIVLVADLMNYEFEIQ